MRLLPNKLRAVPSRWRWSVLTAVALLGALVLAWLFLNNTPNNARNTPNSPPFRPALGQVITREGYVSAVQRALSDVQTAKAASGDTRTRSLDQAAKTLEGVEGAGIISSSGSLPIIDNTLLIQRLRESNPDVEGIESSLDALAGSLRDDTLVTFAGTVSGDKALPELKSVLSDPAFNYERNLSPLERLARWLSGFTGQADPGDTLWQWLVALVAGLVSGFITYVATERIKSRRLRLLVSVGAGLLGGMVFYLAVKDLGTTFKVLGAVGLVVAAISVALILAGMRRSSAPGRPTRVSELAAVLGMSAAEARRQAEESAGKGDYRAAIRYRCLAVLLALDEADMLHFDRTATNREYLFKAPGTLQNSLQPLLDRFEAVWYGGASTDTEEWQDYTARATEIEGRVAAEVRERHKPARSAA